MELKYFYYNGGRWKIYLKARQSEVGENTLVIRSKTASLIDTMRKKSLKKEYNGKTKMVKS